MDCLSLVDKLGPRQDDGDFIVTSKVKASDSKDLYSIRSHNSKEGAMYLQEVKERLEQAVKCETSTG